MDRGLRDRRTAPTGAPAADALTGHAGQGTRPAQGQGPCAGAVGRSSQRGVFLPLGLCFESLRSGRPVRRAAQAGRQSGSVTAVTSSRPALSCVFPPGPRVVEYAKGAERLGYHRIWLYDSPALYGDVWISLARIADATERIGLGTGVAIPSLRHPMVTASAIADIERSAPGRLVVAVGTGFTGRLAMGGKPMRG